MANWQRRALGILAIGGGAIGLSSTMIAVLQRQGLATTNFFVLALGVAFFGWGIWCGVQMIEGGAQAVRRNATFWFFQVPLLQTSVLTYVAFCGAQLQAYVTLSRFDIKFHFAVLGAQYGLSVGQPVTTTAFGVNVFAAGIAFWLTKHLHPTEAASPRAVTDPL